MSCQNTRFNICIWAKRKFVWTRIFFPIIGQKNFDKLPHKMEHRLTCYFFMSTLYTKGTEYYKNKEEKRWGQWEKSSMLTLRVRLRGKQDFRSPGPMPPAPDVERPSTWMSWILSPKLRHMPASWPVQWWRKARSPPQ